MIAWRWLVAAALLLAGTAAEARPIPPAALVAWLDRTIPPRLAKDHVAGGAVAVVQGGKLIALRGYGVASVAPRRPVDPARTLFGLASTSKIVTWTLLLRAAEAGRVDLRRPVNDYLPPALRIPEGGFRHPILVADLLRHTTGFEDRDVGVVSPHAFGGYQPSIPKYLRDARPEREREPGIDPNYSNYAPNLAAYLALQGSGAPDFDALAERDLFAPLGMASTTFREPAGPPSHAPAAMPPALAARRSAWLDWDGNRFVTRPYEHMMDGPASGLSTTAADMARLMLAELGDGAVGDVRVYGSATARAFRTPLLDGAQSNGWAGGLMVLPLAGWHRAYGHDGGTPSTAASLFAVPDLDLGVFAVTNSEAGGQLVWNLADALVRHFYAPAAPGPGHPRPGSPTLVREAWRYEGTWLSERRPYHGLAEMVQFQPQRTTVDAAGYLHASAEGRERRWVPAGSPGAFVDAEGEQVLALRFGADGRAVSWRDPEATRTWARVSPLLASEWLPGLLGSLALVLVLVLLAAGWRWVRRARDTRPAAVRRFDRVEVGSVLLLPAMVACAVLATAAGEENSINAFAPLPLRLFSLAVWALLACLLVLLWRAPALWRAPWPAWRRGLRLVALVPLALLVARIGATGGLEFWR